MTDAEKTLLARGLNFSLPPRRPRFCDFLAPFEKLYGILKKEPIAKNPINGFDEELIKTRIKDIALMGYKTYIPPKSIFSDEFKITEGLQKDNNIYLIKPDLPKVHKPNFPLRPIISAIGTHSYKLAKFLVPLLRPFSTNTFTINDTFSFVKELRELKINTNDVIMASFDVKSLSTNIPLDETIDIIINKCFASATHYHAISRDQFRDLLNLSVKNCHFLFDGVLYKQVDGVAMGSPLGPLFANIFLSFHEKSWLADSPSLFKPIFYRRIVDMLMIVFLFSHHVTMLLLSSPI